MLGITVLRINLFNGNKMCHVLKGERGILPGIIILFPETSPSRNAVAMLNHPGTFRITGRKVPGNGGLPEDGSGETILGIRGKSAK